MAEGSVRLPPDSTGTTIRTVTNPSVAGGTHQEVVTLADAAGGRRRPVIQDISRPRRAPAVPPPKPRPLVEGRASLRSAGRLSVAGSSSRSALAIDEESLLVLVGIL